MSAEKSKANPNETKGTWANILDEVVNPDYRAIKEYLIDSKGQLRLYHPISQRILLKVLLANGLLDELKAFDEKNKADC